jgi:hypothetical protein
MKDPKRFYTYAYLREDGTPYYIGKGQGRRIFQSIGKPCNIPKDKNRIIYLKKNLLESDAFKHEIYMISVFGRKDLETGILYNKSNGGEGASGMVVTEEMKKKWSDERRGKKKPKQSENMKGEKNPMYGKKRTDDEKERIRQKVLLNNPQRGTFWWNNGVEEIRSKECPGLEWKKGRLEKCRDSNGKFVYSINT